jgi:hypothetical protein
LGLCFVLKTIMRCAAESSFSRKVLRQASLEGACKTNWNIMQEVCGMQGLQP